ncbi:MAG: ABC transporter permease [Pseudomonadota bacterium]
MTVAETAPPILDQEEERRARRERLERLAKWTLPSLVMAATILAWHLYVTIGEVPHYILPGPGRVFGQIVSDWTLLGTAALTTFRLAMIALAFAVVAGFCLAVAFTQSKFVEMSFFPYAVIIQVTPVVSIAPLLQLYLQDPFAAALACAWIVAFFPMLSNTTIGLKSTDRNLEDLFTIYGANRWQRLRLLKMPSALPYFLGGLKISGGLALIGAVVAEFVIGRNGTGLGLASLILEAGYRLNYPRMFAALILISIMGVLIFAATSLISHLLLYKWHESALKRDR